MPSHKQHAIVLQNEAGKRILLNPPSTKHGTEAKKQKPIPPGTAVAAKKPAGCKSAPCETARQHRLQTRGQVLSQLSTHCRSWDTPGHPRCSCSSSAHRGCSRVVTCPAEPPVLGPPARSLVPPGASWHGATQPGEGSPPRPASENLARLKIKKSRGNGKTKALLSLVLSSRGNETSKAAIQRGVGGERNPTPDALERTAFEMEMSLFRNI